MVVHLITASLAFIIGVVAGLFYYAGLWWTVRRATRSRYAGLLLGASFLFRVTLLMLVFVLVMQDEWHRLAFCLLGFIVSRFVAMRKFGPSTT